MLLPPSLVAAAHPVGMSLSGPQVNVTGVVLWDGFLQSLLLGVILMQMFWYLQLYGRDPKESWARKIFVSVVVTLVL